MVYPIPSCLWTPRARLWKAISSLPHPVVTPWGKPQDHPPTYLLQGDDEEGAAPRALSDDGQEAGIDSAEMVIVHILGDWDAVKAVLAVGHLPVDVSELGAAVLRTPGHLSGSERRWSVWL